MASNIQALRRIDHLEEKQAKNNKRFWLVFTSEQQDAYYLWNSDLAATMHEGEVWACTIKPGEYPEIIDASLAVAAQPAAQPAPKVTAEKIQTVTKEESIERAVALKAAVEYVKESRGRQIGKTTTEDVLNIADSFLKWLRK
ncbi:MAG: hypothetical protein QMD85_01410 [Candidatus Aenigmarchaeota archaeon]|nr:hypothetical protein [Candidatus Aenigmarchaeota archaeon]